MGMEGRLTSWNAGSERLFGYEAREIVGRHFSGFFSREDLATGRPAVEIRAAHTNGYTANDCWQIRKDGSRFWCRVTVTSLHDANGRVQSFVRTMSELDSPQLAFAPDNMATGPAGESPL